MQARSLPTAPVREEEREFYTDHLSTIDKNCPLPNREHLMQNIMGQYGSNATETAPILQYSRKSLDPLGIFCNAYVIQDEDKMNKAPRHTCHKANFSRLTRPPVFPGWFSSARGRGFCRRYM